MMRWSHRRNESPLEICIKTHVRHTLTQLDKLRRHSTNSEVSPRLENVSPFRVFFCCSSSMVGTPGMPRNVLWVLPYQTRSSWSGGMVWGKNKKKKKKNKVTIRKRFLKHSASGPCICRSRPWPTGNAVIQRDRGCLLKKPHATRCPLLSLAAYNTFQQYT